jgi:hypothetical protein
MVLGSITSQVKTSVGSSKNGSTKAVDWIGHQNHVRFLDALPAGDGRTVEHLAVLEHIFVHGC